MATDRTSGNPTSRCERRNRLPALAAGSERRRSSSPKPQRSVASGLVVVGTQLGVRPPLAHGQKAGPPKQRISASTTYSMLSVRSGAPGVFRFLPTCIHASDANDDPARYESRVSLNIGKTRDVLVSYAANPGRSSMSRRHSSLRSSPVTSVASTGNVAVPTSTVIRGFFLRL